MKRCGIASLYALGCLMTVHQARAVDVTPGGTVSISGTTVSMRPELMSLIVRDDIVNWTTDDGLTFGTLQTRVSREINTGVLEFEYRIINDAASVNSVFAGRFEDFTSFTTDVDFRLDGLGDVGPVQVKRVGAGGTSVNFIFGASGVAPGQSSRFMFVRTNALGYENNIGNLLVGTALNPSKLFTVWSPSIIPSAWYEFQTYLSMPGRGCPPADPSVPPIFGTGCTPSPGTPTIFAGAPPYMIVSPSSGALLTVTDAFDAGDILDVFDFGKLIGTTSPSPVTPSYIGSADPELALLDPRLSHGVFQLPPGPHSITFMENPAAASDPNGVNGPGGAHYFEVTPVQGQACPTDLRIINYHLVSQTPAAGNKVALTYTADLLEALGMSTATLTSSDPFTIEVVPGQDTLTFGPVSVSSLITSNNSFTIIVDPTVPVDFCKLNWTITTASPILAANPGPNKVVGPGSTVTLDGSGSSDPSGAPLTYSWMFTSRPPGSITRLFYSTGPTAQFVADVAGMYIVALTVSDGSSKATASVTITAQ